MLGYMGFISWVRMYNPNYYFQIMWFFNYAWSSWCNKQGLTIDMSNLVINPNYAIACLAWGLTWPPFKHEIMLEKAYASSSSSIWAIWCSIIIHHAPPCLGTSWYSWSLKLSYIITHQSNQVYHLPWKTSDLIYIANFPTMFSF